ncbi:hypothetical protein E1B28_000613 [Marasmius oreades]|uniref:F-box domain-containing protein n=1 Tax=Marasmius oreades TaxID=181124 RepID=A0A9P8AES9_9AGAR|nr:uncharacterized protein E1B28_000613 [Marasmius oreades]KAG7098700.1 hypothetical protein E1B28_000613 [Marasmius oreades]
MSKHRLSPAPLPPAKRLHNLSECSKHSRIRLTFDNALYDELVFCIFSHLSWIDLCAAQATNKNWARLATDNALWKAQFLKVFGSRLRGARGFRSDGREVKSLPTRAKTQDNKVEEYKDWKWMFRVSSNWRKGRCSTEGVSLLHHTPIEQSYQTHVLVCGSTTIIAPTFECVSPAIYLIEPEFKLCCRSTYENTQASITALALDQSTATNEQTRLACFISTGEFSVYSIDHINPSTSSRKSTYTPHRRTSRVTPILQAVYHHPLLITLSEAFCLCIYDLSSDRVTLTQTLSSYTSFPPSSLVLSTPSPQTYKLILIYALPVYPAHWSVAATELMIAGPHSSPSPNVTIASSSSYLVSNEPSPLTILSTRTARALDVPQGWVDDRKLRYLREQWGRKVTRIADTQSDGKWVVLAPGDSFFEQATPTVPASSSGAASLHTSSSLYSPTTLQLYRLSLPVPSSVSSSPPKLTFVRSLNGQLGPISSLALADGRCVSFGLNGSIWVWDLEAGSGSEVASPQPGLTYSDIGLWQSRVTFDERRIITTTGRKIETRTFDI